MARRLGRRNFQVDELPEQLQTFQVRKTKCFCCTSALAVQENIETLAEKKHVDNSLW